ncbi:hypothetical protein CASFOL_024013 [Castilleja foliolosa]|uniref:Radical SAM core domain-containing protein n=1 Tax=Castilleja foliolosa TaxID=1961234 RepID=A0ABD3CP77_9LAMI
MNLTTGFGTLPSIEMKLSQGPWMRRQLATVTFHTIPSSSNSFRSIRFPSINSCSLTNSLSHNSFPVGRSLSFSASAATLPSSISPTAPGTVENSRIPVKDSKVLLKGMRYDELEKWVQSHGYRPGQAMMLWKRLYGDNVWAHNYEELEGLNKDFKRMLGEHADFKALHFKDMYTASDGTKKWVTDIIHVGRWAGYRNGRDSLQKGTDHGVCFQSSGLWDELPVLLYRKTKMGLKRNLSAAEIVEQAVFARRLLSHEVGSITNVVFMGMGEPLHNIENVLKAADILVDDQGLHFSPRKVTVSTSGLVPQIKRFLKESDCALAVSLNATTDEVRNWVMPINRKYKLELLLSTLREELSLKHKYKVLFEYVMLAGVNDSIEDAKRLIDLVQGIPCKINLIPFNPHCGSQFKPTREEKMIEFRNILAEAGCVVLLRSSRGDDKMAACGQLGEPGEIQAPLLKVPPKFQMALEASV